VTPFESTAEMGGAFTPMVHARAEQMDLVELVTPVGSEIEYNFAVAEAIGAGASETTFSGRLIWELDAAGALAPRLVPAPTQLPEPDPPSIPDPEPVEPEAPPFVPPPIAEPPTAEAPPAKAPIMEWPVFEAVTGIPVEFPMNNGWLPQPDLWQLVKDYPAIDWGIAAIDVTESSFEFIADGEFILLRHSIAPIVTFDDAPQRNASFADSRHRSFQSGWRCWLGTLTPPMQTDSFLSHRAWHWPCSHSPRPGDAARLVAPRRDLIPVSPSASTRRVRGDPNNT
jgi:hypothetical protein